MRSGKYAMTIVILLVGLILAGCGTAADTICNGARHRR
jgi:uncharacterized membrane protein YczE